MTLSDEQLIEKIKFTDDETERGKATDELISRYIRVIGIKARRLKSSSLDEEDLTSEGFLGLLAAIRSYSPEKGGFSPFANTCIANRMKTALLKTKDEPVPMEDFDFCEVLDDNPPAEDLIIRNEQQKELWHKLSEVLSEREKTVLGMYLNSFSYQQISERLKIPAKAVDNALSRARAKLRAHYYK